MYRVAIALIDATRARLFTFDRITDTSGTHEQLIERTDLTNPIGRRAPRGDDAEACRIQTVASGAGARTAPYLRQIEGEFARTAMAALRELIDEYRPTRAILCASPRMLDRLRAAAPGLIPDELRLDELGRDLVALPAAELRTALASHGRLPAVP